jgi:hypothetical protein
LIFILESPPPPKIKTMFFLQPLQARSLFKSWEVPAFAGMTTLLGGWGRFQPPLESVQITPHSQDI